MSRPARKPRLRMSEDLFDALSAELARQDDERDRAVRLEAIPAAAAALLESYRADPVLGELVARVARHLGEEPGVLLRGAAAVCAPGRHRDAVIRLELRELQAREAAK